MRLQTLGSIFFFCYAQLAIAAPALPKAAHIPGGVAIVQLDTQDSSPPEVYYQNHRVLVLRSPADPSRWISIVGIPLDAQPGVHELQVKTSSNMYKKMFGVKSKAYPQEHLTIANTRKVLPLAEDLPLIEAQYEKTIESYSHWNYKDLSSAVLALPVQGRKSSPFGMQRFMNKIPQNPHSGLDIAAAKGTPVKNAKAGTVINIGNYFYSGRIVFVDHGQGFITSYRHLDKVTVSVGQELKQGDIIGTIGTSGRATGPHLHWSVSLNGVRVDPQWFVYE